MITLLTHGTGELEMNSTTGLYEYRAEIIQATADHLEARLLELDFKQETEDKYSGSFTHMVSGFAPVRITFTATRSEEHLVFSKFTMEGGISSVPAPLEQLPGKAQKKWLKIIHEHCQTISEQI